MANFPDEVTEFLVHEVMYTPCVHERAYVTLSYHRTKAGAYKAMRAHRLKKWAEDDEMYRNSDATRQHFTKKSPPMGCYHTGYVAWRISKNPIKLTIEE